MKAEEFKRELISELKQCLQRNRVFKESIDIKTLTSFLSNSRLSKAIANRARKAVPQQRQELAELRKRLEELQSQQQDNTASLEQRRKVEIQRQAQKKNYKLILELLDKALYSAVPKYKNIIESYSLRKPFNPWDLPSLQNFENPKLLNNTQNFVEILTIADSIREDKLEKPRPFLMFNRKSYQKYQAALLVNQDLERMLVDFASCLKDFRYLIQSFHQKRLQGLEDMQPDQGMVYYYFPQLVRIYQGIKAGSKSLSSSSSLDRTDNLDIKIRDINNIINYTQSYIWLENFVCSYEPYISFDNQDWYDMALNLDHDHASTTKFVLHLLNNSSSSLITRSMQESVADMVENKLSYQEICKKYLEQKNGDKNEVR